MRRRVTFTLMLVLVLSSSCLLSSCVPVFPASSVPLDTNIIVSVENPRVISFQRNSYENQGTPDGLQYIREVNIRDGNGSNHHPVPGPNFYLTSPLLSPDRRCVTFKQTRVTLAGPPTDADPLNLASTEQIIAMPARGGPASVLLGSGSNGVELIGWMPDSRGLCCYIGQYIKIIDKDGNIHDLAGGLIDGVLDKACVSPDGKHLAMIEGSGPTPYSKKIVVTDISGNSIINQKQLYTSDSLNYFDSSALWDLPSTMTWIGNKQLAFLELSSNKPSPSIKDSVWSLDIETGSRKLLYEAPGQAVLTDLITSPDQHEIAFLISSSMQLDKGLENLDSTYSPTGPLTLIDLKTAQTTEAAGGSPGGYLNW